MRRVASITTGILIACLLTYAQDQNSGLQQQLNSRIQLTQVARDRNTITSQGTAVQLNKSGLVMYSVESPLPPTNSYKNGKISQGGSGFGRDLLITMAAPGNSTSSDYPHRQFGPGEALWVIRMDVHPKDIAIRLLSEPVDGIRYYGDLKITVEANSTPEQALGKIAEILVVGAGDPEQSQPAVAEDGQPGSAAGLYRVQKTGAQVQLEPDGSFTLRAADGHVSPGRYSVNGNKLVLTYLATGLSSQPFTIQGNNVYLNGSLAWTRIGGAPTTSAAAAPPAQLVFPAVYVSAQTPADQLHLNADKSFSLQEGGQPYHGSFEIVGTTLKLKINETDSTTEITLQNKDLVDGTGTRWVLQSQKAN